MNLWTTVAKMITRHMPRDKAEELVASLIAGHGIRVVDHQHFEGREVDLSNSLVIGCIIQGCIIKDGKIVGNRFVRSPISFAPGDYTASKPMDVKNNWATGSP